MADDLQEFDLTATHFDLRGVHPDRERGQSARATDGRAWADKVREQTTRAKPMTLVMCALSRMRARSFSNLPSKLSKTAFTALRLK